MNVENDNVLCCAFCSKWMTLLDICVFSMLWEGWDLVCNSLWNIVLAYGELKSIVIQLYFHDSETNSSICPVHEGSKFTLRHIFEFEESLFSFDLYLRMLKSPFMKEWHSTARNIRKRQRHIEAEVDCKKNLSLGISQLNFQTQLHHNHCQNFATV